MRFHVIKREDCPLWKKALLYVGAVAVALLLGSLLLLALGVNPLAYFSKMFTMGMVGNKIAYRTFENYLKVFVPLVITSVALSLAFRMRFWNIGGEGQFIMGAIAAAAVAGAALPQPLTLALMCAAAMVAAGLYGLMVAALKVKFGTNETLLTLMLNYIALYVLLFLGETKGEWNFFLDANSARPVFAPLVSAPPLLTLGKFRLSPFVPLALLVGVAVHIYLKYTKHGYEIAVVGDSMGTARYAGMKVHGVVLRTVFLSACLIGLAAFCKVSTAGILSTAITDDVGWTGIIVAWLSKLHTGAIFGVAALISMLHYGSTVAATSYAAVDSSFANMLQGAILFMVLMADFYTRFQIVRVGREEQA